MEEMRKEVEEHLGEAVVSDPHERILPGGYGA